MTDDVTPRASEERAEGHDGGVEDSPASTPENRDGRYVLDREIAQGGMGRVFAGRDLRLGREVAIKILRQPLASAMARFEQEVRLAARLQHPGIVTVYDAGFWSTGEPFLIMKLVLGRSFDRVIADAETLRDRLTLLPNLVAVADAVAYAHDLGVVHRDLKPSNIIVGAFGETVVIDWGLAKSLRAPDPPRPAQADDNAERPSSPRGLTLEGAVLGTPAYMPPEQAAGEAVDARADVYALGALLYQTLAGEPPATEPGHPARLAELEPQVPADLLAIVGKAMASGPDDRYPSAFEMADDLKRLLAGQLVHARRYSWLARLRRPLAKRWPTLLVLLVAWLALAFWRC